MVKEEVFKNRFSNFLFTEKDISLWIIPLIVARVLGIIQIENSGQKVIQSPELSIIKLNVKNPAESGFETIKSRAK